MIEPGTYVARILGGAFDKNKKGNLAIGIQFGLKDRADKIWLVRYMTPDALEFTMKDLATLGFSSSPNTDENGRFGADQFSDPNKEFELVIDHETYEGKTRAKVKFVNEIGGGMKFGNLDPKSLKFELNSINFKAEIEAAKRKLGINSAAAPAKKLENHAPQKKVEPSFDENEEIPF